MELLAPAGDLEKLRYAYTYGADAAYIGLHQFSLRNRARNIGFEDAKQLSKIKGDKKLYAAINSYMSEQNIELLKQSLPSLEPLPFDAFIVSDLGTAALLRKYFGSSRELHLSTQANSLNSESVKAYREFGFSRVILGREVPLKEIRKIKERVSDVEIEAFVHGSMCMAYSGRCFLSAFMSGRSANEGDCAHSCRYDYKLYKQNPLENYALEESTRRGEYFPVYEGDDYTTILSSKDLCMIDHLKELKESGVDAIKIEGRMKSLYYVATVTRAYRKALDALDNKADSQDYLEYRNELFNVSHREYSTGFFFDSEQIDLSTDKEYLRNYLLIGTINQKVGPNLYSLNLKNKIEMNQEIEYIGPTTLSVEDSTFSLFDEQNTPITFANHHQNVFLKTDKELKTGFIIRKKL
ncbi:MAG: U32 family peptidase [Sphaerochaetaceae bacterium]